MLYVLILAGAALTAFFVRQRDARISHGVIIQTLAPWLASQGDGPSPAFERLTKQLDHGPYFAKLMRVLGGVATAGSKNILAAAPVRISHTA